MRFLSVDTETTGIDKDNCEILSFSAVLEDSRHPEIPVEHLPFIHVIFKRELITGEPFALNMNKGIIEIIKEGNDKRLIAEVDFWGVFYKFLNDNGVHSAKLKVVGKNFSSFDRAFIEKALNQSWKDHRTDIGFHHRVLDVGSMFVNFKTDEWLPSLNQCMERAGVQGTVQHCAYEDAKDVIRVIRTKY